MPIAFPKLWQSKCLQTLPNVPWEVNCQQLRITDKDFNTGKIFQKPLENISDKIDLNCMAIPKSTIVNKIRNTFISIIFQSNWGWGWGIYTIIGTNQVKFLTIGVSLHKGRWIPGQNQKCIKKKQRCYWIQNEIHKTVPQNKQDRLCCAFIKKLLK